MVRLSKTFRIEAAHLLPRVPEGHKCRRLHGHSYKIGVVVAGQVDPETGWLMDYAAITDAFAPLFQQLDHHYLNEVEGLDNPTSEILARWIWERLQPRLPELAEVRIDETCTSACSYFGEAEAGPGDQR
jgi:6-pyruvoyltetrahydropterin/6-carboxytetrahydropterin synthase